MQLHCPECHLPIKAEDVNMEAMAAKCGSCNHVFFFDRDGIKPGAAVAVEKPLVELPDGMSMRQMLSQLEIRYSWRRHANGFLIFFGITWNLMLLPFIGAAIFTGELMVFVGISLHLLVGVGLLYYILACLFNATYIAVTPTEIKIEHVPLPFPTYPKRVVSAEQLEQLFVKKYSSGKTNGQPVWAFAVEGVLKNQATLTLVKGFKTADYALYVEQQIEKFLRLKDQRVKEEWSGNYA